MYMFYGKTIMARTIDNVPIWHIYYPCANIIENLQSTLVTFYNPSWELECLFNKHIWRGENMVQAKSLEEEKIHFPVLFVRCLEILDIQYKQCFRQPTSFM